MTADERQLLILLAVATLGLGDIPLGLRNEIRALVERLDPNTLYAMGGDSIDRLSVLIQRDGSFGSRMLK